MASIILIVGTRPELIKIAPVVHELLRRGMSKEFIVVNTAQHKDLLDPYWEIFGIHPNHTLDIMLDNQHLTSLTSRALLQIQEFIEGLENKPKLILAQGDTTTVMAASIVAFYNHIEFVHLEAGLRSFDLDNPFPEEYNRKVAAIHCSLHLCPTEKAKKNLLAEGYSEGQISLVGNTVIDALNFISKQKSLNPSKWLKDFASERLKGKKLILITCHRRENHGERLLNIIDAVYELAIAHNDYFFLWSSHPNPNVRNVVINSKLKEISNVEIVHPLNYMDLIYVMKQCVLIISDSGGIQEEAPSFNVPVLVLREKTERPEGVEMNIAKLVGANKSAIIDGFNLMRNDKKKEFLNPYGDGKSAERIVDLLLAEIQR